MALDETTGARVAPRRRRRMMGPPDPITEALAGGGDRPEFRPVDEAGSPWGMDEDPGDADALRNLLQTRQEGLEQGRYPAEQEQQRPPVEDLLAMLQNDEDPGGETPAFGPLDEEGDPWGMDTDPGDADVLRNLLALRGQGLRQGRYR